LPALSIGDHSAALLGGFTASYTAELGTINEKNPKTRSMTLNARKLTGMIRMSNELATDIPGGSDQIVNLCGNGLAWYRDKAFLKGSGAGEPLGILNSGCLVEVDPEGGQGSGVIYENLTKMLSRLFAGSFKNSVWVCHQTLIPSLLQLSIAVGTGGSAVPVMTESNGEFKILTRPVIFTEKTETLGTKGDIMLCDFSQYVVGLRSGMRFDTSIHAHFATDELLARIIERHDGQPLWDSPLTLADGSTTVSPFVTLGDR
jgi:HK97 family phage major capsid protein